MSNSSHKNIIIVDYKVGNKHSIVSAIQKVAGNIPVELSADINKIKQASHLVFPGVGAIKDCLLALEQANLVTAVLDHMKSGKPTLAICVGMQLLFKSSAENNHTNCFNIFADEVTKLPQDLENQIKVPHMGWNKVVQRPHFIWQNIADNSYFYFVHSYAAKDINADCSVGICTHKQPFVAVVAKDNIVATQFHPEKSHDNGLQLLDNFVQWNYL